MITAVELPLPLQSQLRAEALSACPRECCGLLEGVVEDSLARVVALHPMSNVANEADRFEIDPAQQIALLRVLRGTEHAIIGCYHSHPNGRAEPSERDRESAIEPDFLWLICAVKESIQTSSIAGFVSGGQSYSPVRIVHQLPGTAGRRPAAGKDARGPGKGSLDRSAAPPI
jgi:proteasome lid subunit RPN8/RPN11